MGENVKIIFPHGTSPSSFAQANNVELCEKEKAPDVSSGCSTIFVEIYMCAKSDLQDSQKKPQRIASNRIYSIQVESTIAAPFI